MASMSIEKKEITGYRQEFLIDVNQKFFQNIDDALSDYLYFYENEFGEEDAEIVLTISEDEVEKLKSFGFTVVPKSWKQDKYTHGYKVYISDSTHDRHIFAECA